MTLLFIPCQAMPSVHQVTFDYSTLKAHILKTTNDRNEQISDSESRHLVRHTELRKGSCCPTNIHACNYVLYEHM